jgi:hypothetical protein
METIIQAGNKRMKIASVPIETNAKTRESRLFKSMPEHIMKSGAAIVRSYMMYKPYAIFVWLTAFFFVLGAIPFVRYLVLWLSGDNGNHIQSLLLGGVLINLAFMSAMLGVISDLIRTNRVLIEDDLEHTKKARFGKSGTEMLRDQTSVAEFDLPHTPRAGKSSAQSGETWTTSL